MRRALCWLRRDLRLSDHSALAEATKTAEEVGVVFVFDTNILDVLPDRDDKRVSFIHRSLHEVDARLKTLGSRLIVLHGDPVEEIPKVVENYQAEAVFAARDYEPYAVARDQAVGEKIPLRLIKDSVVMDPDEILTLDGKPQRLYRSYKIGWQRVFRYDPDAVAREPDLTKLIPLESGGWLGLPKLGFTPSAGVLEAGETAAEERLDAFQKKLKRYEQNRNLVTKDGTSMLSVDLRFGTLSPRACIRAALAQGGAGEKWLSELIWRDYFQNVLFHFPQVVEGPFQEQYGNIDYPGGDDHYEAWIAGQTGYPIVDAAMRCLDATGWIDNRLRLIVAGFLVKNLLVDYRKGEAWFARKLLDFDLASNNGNWQWAASVGADPQPFFRSFNPILQSEKTDPEGVFIRRWVPELAKLSGSTLHFPAAAPLEVELAGIRLGVDYPFPLVDQKETRERAKALLVAARSAE